MRANSVPGGTIREGALFFQTVAAAGALFKRGHYSRGGTIRASTVVEISAFSRFYDNSKFVKRLFYSHHVRSED